MPLNIDRQQGTGRSRSYVSKWQNSPYHKKLHKIKVSQGSVYNSVRQPWVPQGLCKQATEKHNHSHMDIYSCYLEYYYNEELQLHHHWGWDLDLPYILKSNPHPFYSFRGLKNQIRITVACGLDSRSRAGFWKNDGATVRAVRTIQYNNLLFYLLLIIIYCTALLVGGSQGRSLVTGDFFWGIRQFHVPWGRLSL